MPDYRDELFATYERHSGSIDPADDAKIEWFRAYANSNYIPLLATLDRASANVLEVGCNKGYLLKVLSDFGFQHVAGVDVSMAEVARARTIVPTAVLEAVDAVDYIDAHRGEFDVILMKAVLEHVEKGNVIPFIRSVSEGLREGGLLIVDVPNMDWLFAPHERYMDFTHEVGFTRESLRQVLEVVFGEVDIHPVELTLVSGRALYKRTLARKVLDTLLSWADGEGVQGPIWSRGLIAAVRRP